MSDLLQNVLLFLGGGALNAIGVYIAYRNMKITDKTSDYGIMKNLQEIADKATTAQNEAVEAMQEHDRKASDAMAKLKEEYDTIIFELREQIKLLLEGDLKVELIIGGNPKMAKYVRIENVMARPPEEPEDHTGDTKPVPIPFVWPKRK